MKDEILMTTQDQFLDYKIKKTLGVVFGNTVRSRNAMSGMIAGFKMVVGGEVKGYTKAIHLARDEAKQRMVEEALEMGATGIVCVRFTVSEILGRCVEVLAFGTAVVLEK